MKPHRAHYRPLFGVGVGRSPPFLVAALFIGLCILAFSYFRLALQYHDLEEQMKRLVQKRDSLEANQNFINKQLEIREENFSEAKVSLQKKEQELEDLKKKQAQNDNELIEIKASLEQIKQTNDKLKSDTAEKDRNVDLLRSQNKVLENVKSKLEIELKNLQKEFLNSKKVLISNVATASNNSSSVANDQRQQQQLPAPALAAVAAAKNSVVNLLKKSSSLNASSGGVGSENQPQIQSQVQSPQSAAAANHQQQQQISSPKVASQNAHAQQNNQIAPPPDEVKNLPPGVAEEASQSKDSKNLNLKAQESRNIPEIIDPANMMIDDADLNDKDADPDPKIDRNDDQRLSNANRDSSNDLELPAAGAAAGGVGGDGKSAINSANNRQQDINGSINYENGFGGGGASNGENNKLLNNQNPSDNFLDSNLSLLQQNV